MYKYKYLKYNSISDLESKYKKNDTIITYK
jgi:hypothetical protein